jgi:hypothetical protein
MQAAQIWQQPSLTAGLPYLDDFVSNLAMIPAKTTRDFLNREAAKEHFP